MLDCSPFGKLDDTWASAHAGVMVVDNRRGLNRRHGLVEQVRQSVYSRLGGYEDVNHADWLPHPTAQLAPRSGGIAGLTGKYRLRFKAHWIADD
jgi:hypothetical protein